MSNIYCVVFIGFVCVPNVASFSGLTILDCSFGFLTFIYYLILVVFRECGILCISFYYLYFTLKIFIVKQIQTMDHTKVINL